MMETDGIEDAFEGTMRMLMTSAGQIGEQLARSREARLRQAQQHGEFEARQMQTRLEAEQRAAIAEMNRVHQDHWWQNAAPEDIAYSYQVARSLGPNSAEGLRAEERIRHELQARHGMSIEDLHRAPEARQEATQAQEEQGAAAGERQRAEHEAYLARQAAEEMETSPEPERRTAARAERDHHEHEGEYAYDSAERRGAWQKTFDGREPPQRL